MENSQSVIPRRLARHSPPVGDNRMSIKANICELRAGLRASDRATATYRWLCIPITPGGAASGPSWWFGTRDNARAWAKLRNDARYVVGRIQ